MNQPIRLFLAACSAALLALAFTDVWDGAVWFALAPALYLVAAATTRRQALLLSMVFAWVWSIPCLWFLAKTTAIGAVVGGLYTGLWYVGALLAVRYAARHGTFMAVFGTAAIWSLIEIGRSRIPVLEFPWLLLGHATASSEALRQGADLMGVYGLSFLVAAVNGALAFLVAPLLFNGLEAPPGTPWGRRVVLIAVPACLLIALCYGHWRVEHLRSQLRSDGPRVVVIQGCEYNKLDRTEEAKEAQLLSHIELHRKAAAQSPRPDLICWAETMVPGIYNQERYAEQFRAVVREIGIPTLCGVDFVHPDDLQKPFLEQRWSNMVMLLNGKAETLGEYAKRRLVPFGEYIPFKSVIPALKRMVAVTRDAYKPGTAPSPVVPLAGLAWGFNVCVEDCHPDLARETALDGADGFLNVTNDAWFAGTHEPVTHLRGALFRCIETRRPMIRATNSGCSAFIDPLGRAVIDPPLDQVGLGAFRVSHLESPGRTLAMCFGEGWVALALLVVGCVAWVVDRELQLISKETVTA